MFCFFHLGALKLLHFHSVNQNKIAMKLLRIYTLYSTFIYLFSSDFVKHGFKAACFLFPPLLGTCVDFCQSMNLCLKDGQLWVYSPHLHKSRLQFSSDSMKNERKSNACNVTCKDSTPFSSVSWFILCSISEEVLLNSLFSFDTSLRRRRNLELKY